MPDLPVPTGFGLTRNFYVRAEHIVAELNAMFGLGADTEQLAELWYENHDQPGEWFKGPF